MTRRAWLPVLCAATSSLAACQGCQSTLPTPDSGVPPSTTIRLYVLSTVAGALEPCGCSKDQLGGLDHLAAFVEKEKAPNALLLSAGPLLFIDPTLKADHTMQDQWKAEAIAASMKDLGLAGWAPGLNDWAAGGPALEGYAAQAAAEPLAGNLSGLAALRGATVREIGGVRVGIAGMAEPKDQTGRAPEGVTLEDPVAAADRALTGLEQQGARLLVAVAAMERGAALRLVDRHPSLHVLIVGRPRSLGSGNTEQPVPEIVGSTLVVETANHAQTIALVDVHVRGAGELRLADAGGVAKAAQVADLARRIRELETRINSWSASLKAASGGGAAKVDPKDLAARQADLDRLRSEKSALEAQASATPTGSFFEYRVQEVREGLGSSEPVAARMLAYYKRVNAHNKTAFADRKPPEPAADEARYLGADACTDCHAEEREVWDKTTHARAYETLSKDFKEYNLDCVGCHVTGYGKPGGSTVSFNDALRGVQCEECHGPGSRHAKKPDDASLIVLKPDPKSCVDACHHPPHVEGFDPLAKMDLVLGPGHGK